MFINKFKALAVYSFLFVLAPLNAVEEQEIGLPAESFELCLQDVARCNAEQKEFLLNLLLGKREALPRPNLPPESKKRYTNEHVEELTVKLEHLESPTKSKPKPTIRTTAAGMELSPGSAGHSIPPGFGVIYGHRFEGDTMQEGSIPKNNRLNIKDELASRQETLNDENLNEYLLLAEIALLKAIEKDKSIISLNRYIGESTNLRSRISTAKIQGRDLTTRQGIIVQAITNNDTIKRVMNILIEDVPKDYLLHFEILAGLVFNIFLRPGTYVNELGNKVAWKRVSSYLKWDERTRQLELMNNEVPQTMPRKVPTKPNFGSVVKVENLD